MDNIMDRTPHYGMIIATAILLVAVLVFSAELRSISLVNGWWFDELLSIWASDPSHGFIDVLRKSITENAVLPLYDFGLVWDPAAGLR